MRKVETEGETEGGRKGGREGEKREGEGGCKITRKHFFFQYPFLNNTPKDA